jgi:hypothetical protein
MKPTIEELRSAISLGDEKKACAIFLTGLTIDPEEFLQKIRSKGVFRYANYGFQTRIILQLLEISLATKSGKLSENTTVYLESVRALACIADPIRSLHTGKSIRYPIHSDNQNWQSLHHSSWHDGY